jgi:type III restriction enzyme
LIVQQTINIPRIQVVPKGEVRLGFEPFTLNLDRLNYPAVSEELWVQFLHTGEGMTVYATRGSSDEPGLENHIVRALIDFDDVSYDDHADMLYGLASQVVEHFATYLKPDEISDVLRCHQREIVRFIHVQMQEHLRDEVGGYEVKVSRGFTKLKRRAYSQVVGEHMRDFRSSPPDLAHIARYLFDGFERCLYTEEKFQSDSERMLAVILDRDSTKWFKPARGQFEIF